MKKIFYLIIAFLFCAECDNDGTVKLYGDDLIIINLPKHRIKVVGMFGDLVRHLYNNGHVLFNNNYVNNISDLKKIVEKRYRLTGMTTSPPKVANRTAISYFILHEIAETQDKRDNTNRKVRAAVKDYLFHPKCSSISVNTCYNSSRCIIISFKAYERKEWQYVAENDQTPWVIIAPKIHIVISTSEDGEWVIKTAYAKIDEKWK